MATFNSKTENLYFLFLSTCVAFFFLFLNNVESTEFSSFYFLKSKQNLQGIIYQGDAIWNPNGTKIELTKVINGQPISHSLGRALSPPFRIYESATGSMASFRTYFSFRIQTPPALKFADGLAFFIAPVDTQPQKPGGLLGLFPNDKFNRSNQIIAFEIDTFINKFDPNGRHIGINVNSIRSVNTTFIKLENGQEGFATVFYEASSKVLTASISYASPFRVYEVSTVVDLKDVLPEFVRFGLTATTGLSNGYVQSNDILSLSVDLNLPNSNGNALGNFDVI